MSQIDDIKNKVDIVELIGSMGVSLRKTGRSLVGFCPFHPNSRTPAFTVYPDSQSFYCFGCHASGTAFDFVMRKQGLDFKQALELLAARAGVRLEPKNDQERQEDARRTKLLEINAAAARYFSYVLLNLKRAEPARAYVERRGLSVETVEAFQIGYSLDDWGHLLAYLTEKKGYHPEEVEQAGLTVRRQGGDPASPEGYYDRFRGRLIFPIRSQKGEVLGFGGRAIGDAQPKYLNTPETPLFKKGELLYGLDLAREAIRTEDRTVVVEGYVDVITAHQHGFRNVVAPLGTALTKAHVALLRRLSHNVYLALDADSAGQRATLKGLSAMREAAEEEGGGHLVSTAQGAVRLESDVSLRIIRMPEGRDPDEVIREDPELWRRLLAEAAPVMEFYLAAYTAGLDLSAPEGQKAALDRLLPLLAELDGAQQRVYVARIEQVVGIKAELIIDLLRARVARPGRPAGGREPRRGPGQGRGGDRRPQGVWEAPPDDAPHPAEPGAAPGAPATQPFSAQRSIEGQLLGLALCHASVDPAVELLLERDLAAHPGMREHFGGGLEDLLADPLHRAIWAEYTALPVGWRPSTPEDLDGWAAGLDDPLGARAAELIAYARGRPDPLRFRKEAEDRAIKLREAQARVLQQRLREREADEDFEAALRLHTQLSLYLADLRRPRRSSTFPDLRDSLGRDRE